MNDQVGEGQLANERRRYVRRCNQCFWCSRPSYARSNKLPSSNDRLDVVVFPMGHRTTHHYQEVCNCIYDLVEEVQKVDAVLGPRLHA